MRGGGGGEGGIQELGLGDAGFHMFRVEMVEILIVGEVESPPGYEAMLKWGSGRMSAIWANEDVGNEDELKNCMILLYIKHCERTFPRQTPRGSNTSEW